MSGRLVEPREQRTKRGMLHFRFQGDGEYLLVSCHEDPDAFFSITFAEVDELKAFKDRMAKRWGLVTG